MYKYKINDPEKLVPTNIIEKFFIVIKTGNLDKIRDFVLEYKNKYNLNEKSFKNGIISSGDTAFHIVLELDDKIADDRTKLEILKYLGEMGSPMDLPNLIDIWPIHLAAALQSKKIIDYLVDHNVSLNRKDTSNNTPLHYAIIGKKIDCNNSVKIESLIPVIETNKFLEKNDKLLINLLSTTFNKNLIHMINTLDKLPEIYYDSDFSRELEKNVLTLDPDKLENLIEQTYLTIVDKLLLNNNLNVSINNTGWGPSNIPYKILPKTISDYYLEINDKYNTLKNSILSIDNHNIIYRNILPQIFELNNSFIDKLVFCDKCKIYNDYGYDITLIIMFFLLSLNYYQSHILDIIVHKFLENFNLMSYQAFNLTRHLRQFPINLSKTSTKPYLFGSTINYLFNDNFNSFEKKISNSAIDDNCIRDNLIRIFYPADGENKFLRQSILTQKSIEDLLEDPNFNKFSDDYDENLNINHTWYRLFTSVIIALKIGPKNNTNIFYIRNIGRVVPSRFHLYYNQDNNHDMDTSGFTLLDFIQTMFIIYEYFLTGIINPFTNKISLLLNEPINKYDDVIQIIRDTVLPDGYTLKDSYPNYFFLFEILITYTKNVIFEVINDCILGIIDNYKKTNEINILDDAYMYNLLLPANPDITDFITNDNKHIEKLKKNKWKNNLTKYFKKNISIPDVINISNIVYNNDIIKRYRLNYIVLNELRNIIEEYAIDDSVSENITKEFSEEVKKYFTLIDVMGKFNTISRDITFVDDFDNQFNNIKNNKSTILFFLTEIYGYYFMSFKDKFILIQNILYEINKIISDINIFIKNEVYYYIPQISLPALIVNLVKIFNILLSFNEEKQSFNLKKSAFFNILIIRQTRELNIINLGEEFDEYIEKQNDLLYNNFLELITYHNNVIKFLNMTSAYQIIINNNKNRINKFFSSNLVYIEEFSSLNDVSTLEKIIEKYKIPLISYYGTPNDKNYNYDMFIGEEYRDTINYIRIGELSNSPLPNLNSQLNITFNPINLHNVKPISGSWIKSNSFDNAFIGYKNRSYKYIYEAGAPPSIKELIGIYFKILKQKIIEDTIEYIITNDNEIKENLKNLKNNEINDYIIIAKSLDKIINNILEYAIKRSISNWIYSIISSNHLYPNLENTFNIINHKNYLKITYNSPIEQNPNIIKYSSQPQDFIHYLYDINYFSSSNINSNKKCFIINPNIVSKLITGENINSKNSDGNTPLHLAVDIKNVEIIKLLISKGASNSYTNIYNEKPSDFNKKALINHLDMTKGKIVEKIFNNFIIPFNDLLISRLKQEEYKNNIIKNISLGIPVQLLIYNHLFNLYLQNYRFNITSKIKNSINNIIKKYYDKSLPIYPDDLFEIDPINLAILLNPPIKLTKIKQEEFNQLTNQIDGLKTELTKTTEPEQINFINQLITSLQDKLSKIQLPEQRITPIIYNIITKNTSRNLDLTEYYTTTFKKISSDPTIYEKIWENYLNKELINTSLIFPLLNNIMTQITKEEIIEIKDFYEKVKSYIESKEIYPNNLEDNPILHEEYNEIIYIINLIISPQIYDILLNEISISLKETDLFNSFDQFILTSFNNQTLYSFIFDLLPKLSFKYYTTIYFNNYDDDKKIITGQDLFNPIIQIIKNNNIIQLTDESTLIKNIKEYLIPFFENTYQNFIHHIRLTIYGYERYLLNTYQLLEIYSLINYS